MDNEVRARFFGLSGTVDLCLGAGSACADILVLQSAPVAGEWLTFLAKRCSAH